MVSVMNRQKNRKMIWFTLINKNYKKWGCPCGQPQNFFKSYTRCPFAMYNGKVSAPFISLPALMTTFLSVIV